MLLNEEGEPWFCFFVSIKLFQPRNKGMLYHNDMFYILTSKNNRSLHV